MSDTPTPDSDEALKARKKRYKQSLNLPKTSFPMRANLAQNEPQSLKRWDKEGLYGRLMEARSEAEPFVFHDGPPYANGDIHVGHMLNKVLKDIVVRSRNMAGRRCDFVPGWDCHGLPIEHKVMTELVRTGKAQRLAELEDDNRHLAIRGACAKYASKYHRLQSRQIQRLLTLGDYEQPYLTMAPAYEKGVLDVFAAMLEQGLVYRDLKPVHWSIANQTALAEAELEYQEREDPSVYVHFPVASPQSLAQAFGCNEQELEQSSLMIWTTTPWTLPANLLIAVHREIRYALVQLGGRTVVLAKERVPAVAALGGHEHPRILGEASGEQLVGLEYDHPFCERQGRVVAASYVTTEDGTGLVHTAPGHGHEDYATGLAEEVPIYCPVRGDGTYDDSVPDWLQGLSVWDANERITERLQETGHLHHGHSFVHSYPHDWRSKTPVIFRATEQWFIAVDRPAATHGASLRDMAQRAAEEQIHFVPAWGQRRLRGMLETRPDWCISRQRSWGLPIPAFLLPDGSTFLTRASVAAIAEVFGREGSDAWFRKSAAELLADYDSGQDPEAPGDLDLASLRKSYDIFDVWFESGSSWHAVLRQRQLGYPAELYLEGSDQHRGWFQLSLLPSLGVTGEPSFRTLLTHGFTVDTEGKKMSKSLGNTLDVEDLLKQYGADVCRWWVSSLAFENDITVDLEFFELAGASYRKVRNTLRFLLSNLDDFDHSSHAVDLDGLDPASLDALAMEKLLRLRQDVQAAYESYEVRRAHLLLFDFCNDTLSSLYLSAVKDRLYCDRADSPRRRATQTVLWHLADGLSRLLAPILPHTADEAFRALHGEESTVHLDLFPSLAPVRAHAVWPQVLELRERALKSLEDSKARGIENPLDAGLRLGDAQGQLQPFLADLPDLLGVSRVSLDSAGADTVEVQDLRQEPRCERSWRRDATVRQRSDGGWLSDRDAEAVGLS